MNKIKEEIESAKYKSDALRVMGKYGKGFNDACDRFLRFLGESDTGGMADSE